MDVVDETILEYLRKSVGGNPTLDDQLALVGVDSIGLAELTFELEKRFAIRVDDEIHELQTVRDLADYVRRLRG